MSTGLLFITARCDYKAANRVLLELRDIEYGSGDRLHLILSKTAANLNPTGKDPSLLETPAGSLTKENFVDVNEWAGAGIQEVEAFVSAQGRSLFLVLDGESLAQKTIIIAEESWDDDEEGSEDEKEENEEDNGDDDDDDNDKKPKAHSKHRFNKARFALNEAYGVWANLDITNVGWDEICDQGPEPNDDGWWSVVSTGAGPRDQDELNVRRGLEEEFSADGKI